MKLRREGGHLGAEPLDLGGEFVTRLRELLARLCELVALRDGGPKPRGKQAKAVSSARRRRRWATCGRALAT